MGSESLDFSGFQKGTVEMEVARDRALTHILGYDKLFVTHVEMEVARDRALTHRRILRHVSKESLGRNGGCPRQGIDTYSLNAMSTAAYGRNGGCPRQGIDTFRIVFTYISTFTSRNGGCPRQGIDT